MNKNKILTIICHLVYILLKFWLENKLIFLTIICHIQGKRTNTNVVIPRHETDFNTIPFFGFETHLLDADRRFQFR